MRKGSTTQAKVHFSWSLSRKHLALALALPLMLLPTAFGQTTSSATANPVSSSAAPSITWEQTYSTGDASNIEAMVQTSDGGYALAGMGMYIIVGDIGFWLVKTNSTGSEQWNRAYISDQMNVNLGGANALVQTSDGEYALAGSVNDVSYLVKTDSQGNLQWRQAYSSIADVSSLVQTSDGGYVIAGSNSEGFWLAKVNSTGVLQWSHTYGAGEESDCTSMVQTSDGGYALAGFGGTSGSESNAVLIKTDSFGNMLWTQTYGVSSGSFQAFSLTKTSDGGYALGGMYFDSDSGVVLLIKTDLDGDMQWNQTYSELESKAALSVIQTSDGGYALGCGWPGPCSGNLLKTDSDGNLQWDIACNATVCSVVQLSDGAYVFAGSNYSNYNFLMGTNGSLSSPAPTGLQTPTPTITPLQPPQSTSSSSPAVSSSSRPGDTEASTLTGYYLILAAAIAVAVLTVIVIIAMLIRSNAWLPSRNLHVKDSDEQNDSP